MLLYLISMKSKISSHIKSEITQTFCIIRSHFYTPAIYDTSILKRSVHTQYICVFSGRRNPNVFTTLIIPVNCQIQTFKKGCINTNIVFKCLFVSWIESCKSADFSCSEIWIMIVAKMIHRTCCWVNLIPIIKNRIITVFGKIVSINDTKRSP